MFQQWWLITNPYFEKYQCLNSSFESRANNAESWFLLLMCAVLIFWRALIIAIPINCSITHREKNTSCSEPEQRQGKAGELADHGLGISDTGFCVQVQCNAKKASFKEVEKCGYNETGSRFLSAFAGIGIWYFAKTKIISHPGEYSHESLHFNNQTQSLFLKVFLF